MVIEESSAGGIQARPMLKVPRHVLDAFDSLVVEESEERTKASLIVLQHADSTLKSGEGKELPDDVRYITKRLVNGLTSSRLCAREGCYSTLCSLLQLHPSIATFALSYTSEKFSSSTALTRDEAKDLVLGMLLSYGAFIHSGQISGIPGALATVVSKLCKIRKMRTYLDIMATQFLVDLMEGYTGTSFYNEVWSHVEPEVKQPVGELSPCQLWMRVVLLRKVKQSPPAWLSSTLSPTNYPDLATILLATTNDLPKVHPLLKEFVSSLAATADHTAGSSSPSPLARFWAISMAPLLERTTTSKLQVVFIILQFMLPHLKTVANFKAVITPSVVTLLRTTLPKYSHDIGLAARETASALIQLVADSQDEKSELQLAVVTTLISSPSCLRFDQLAGYKLLAKMIPHFTFRTIKSFAEILMNVIKQTKNASLQDQTFAAHTLRSLMAHRRAGGQEQASWRCMQLVGLMKMAFFSRHEANSSTATRVAFFRALSNQTGHIKEYKEVVMKLVSVADQELKKLEAEKSPLPLSEEAHEQWSQVCSKLVLPQEGEEEGKKATYQVLLVLYCQMALHLFVDVSAATDIIKELDACHREVTRLGPEGGSREEDGKQPHLVDVVTELLLSLMTHETHLFRTVAQGLFWLMCPQMTSTALSLITDILNPTKAQELLKKEESAEGMPDEESEEAMEGENDGEEEGDGDLNGTSDSEDESDGDVAGDEEMEDSDSEEEDEEEGALFTLKRKMIAAQNIDVDVDLDSVPQEELDNLDRQLGLLMAEYQEKHPGGKRKKKGTGAKLPKDERNLMNFQTRASDMLLVYIKTAPSIDLLVGLVNPLFKALEAAEQDKRQKDLQNRLRHLLSQLGKRKKFDSVSNITMDCLVENLNTFFTSVSDTVPKSLQSVVQSCYSLHVHCGCLLLGKQVHQPDNPIITVYANHIETLFSKNNASLKATSFMDPCSYDMGGLWKIVEMMVRISFNRDLKTQHRAQALSFLQKLYQNKAVVAERGEAHARNIEEKLNSSLVQALNNQKESPAHGIFLSSLFQLLVVLHKVDVVKGKQPAFNWEELSDCVIAFRQCISRKSLKAFRRDYNIIQQALKLPKQTCSVQNYPQQQVDNENKSLPQNSSPKKNKKNKKVKKNQMGAGSKKENQNQMVVGPKKKNKNQMGAGPKKENQNQMVAGPKKKKNRMGAGSKKKNKNQMGVAFSGRKSEGKKEDCNAEQATPAKRIKLTS